MNDFSPLQGWRWAKFAQSKKIKTVNNLFRTLFLLPLLWLAACSPSVPEGAVEAADAVQISPDYTSITIPYNIAPLNFVIETDGSEYVTHAYSSKGNGLTVSGRDVKFPIGEWHELLEAGKNDTLNVDIYVKNDGKWVKYPTIKNYIAADPIDPYISYRLIEPSYVGYEVMTINQRNLTDFEEDVIYNNYAISDGENGQCVNCHNYQNYNRDGNMQMHLRQLKGGTLIVVDGDIKKVNLKTDYTISAGVYPSWHPTEKLIAYSTNLTGQNFHTRNHEKVEVQDSESDLILYDIDKNEVSTITNVKHEFESFPAWSPDGKWLYFVSSHFVTNTEYENWELRTRYDSIRYNIFRKPFDLKTRTFGATDTVFMASEYGKSATFPRVSPDGKWLLFALGDYGQFHVWHKSSDLYVMELATRKVYPLREANSPDVDSFHSWSSNGRWIMFTSRRDDGSYTRLYFTYFDEAGHASKAFILPQEDSKYYYDDLFKSYNVPEFMVKKVELDHHDLYDAINGNESIQAVQHERDSISVVKDVSEVDNFYE